MSEPVYLSSKTVEKERQELYSYIQNFPDTPTNIKWFRKLVVRKMEGASTPEAYLWLDEEFPGWAEAGAEVVISEQNQLTEWLNSYLDNPEDVELQKVVHNYVNKFRRGLIYADFEPIVENYLREVGRSTKKKSERDYNKLNSPELRQPLRVTSSQYSANLKDRTVLDEVLRYGGPLKRNSNASFVNKVDNVVRVLTETNGLDPDAHNWVIKQSVKVLKGSVIKPRCAYLTYCLGEGWEFGPYSIAQEIQNNTEYLKENMGKVKSTQRALSIPFYRFTNLPQRYSPLLDSPLHDLVEEFLKVQEKNAKLLSDKANAENRPGYLEKWYESLKLVESAKTKAHLDLKTGNISENKLQFLLDNDPDMLERLKAKSIFTLEEWVFSYQKGSKSTMAALARDIKTGKLNKGRRRWLEEHDPEFLKRLETNSDESLNNEGLATSLSKYAKKPSKSRSTFLGASTSWSNKALETLDLWHNLKRPPTQEECPWVFGQLNLKQAGRLGVREDNWLKQNITYWPQNS